MTGIRKLRQQWRDAKRRERKRKVASGVCLHSGCQNKGKRARIDDKWTRRRYCAKHASRAGRGI